ncbi:uncharacterized protein TRUGW13939_11310 [Talaromyces rugulosus]|uniref:Endonuclease/exonuclease/phosphatase domain-containing protein n=1 Tax=Talaromyces rugulosus TaxID=121627 RepID=A0A7H8RDH9_TALRU|nr:uncharacterized protein TRUGW13939_11310 [Talaromyces rugulosus]QKX64137.1 hypothetical protein TRUGW13939_11310 [Talaromyces rugulosus]
MKALSVATSLAFRLITHNIRFATDNPGTGEEPWSDRAPFIISELKWATSYLPESLICVQEALHNQVEDILNGLNAYNTTAYTSPNKQLPEWGYLGVGRDDGVEAGEYSALFYSPTVWDIDDWTTVWLSETPDKPSIGWDASHNRILTIGKLRHLETGKQVIGMCTHLDDKGKTARINSASLIIEEVNSWANKTSNSTIGTNSTAPIPVFLGGDFNSQPDGDAYKIVANSSSPLQDASDIAAGTYGDNVTFTGFNDADGGRIDFLFLGPKDSQPWNVDTYTVLPNRFENNVYDSDHRAVAVNVRI